MMIDTPWGYKVEELPAIMSVAEFRTLYPNFSSTDDAIETVLGAVSSAIRDACGWHVAPSLECYFIGEGEGNLLVLPAMGVVDVASLSIKGASAQFEWRASGMVRLKSGHFPDSWRSVECNYTAGYSSASVAQVAAQIAANALVASPGVSDERAGGVSITYNKTGDGITGGVSLLQRDRAALAPYKLARAW